MLIVRQIKASFLLDFIYLHRTVVHTNINIVLTWVGKLLVFYPAQQLSLETTSPNATIKLKVDGWLSVVFFPDLRSFVGFTNNAVNKLQIYFNSHMLIVRQIKASFLLDFIYLHRTVVHTNINMLFEN
jgi:uncharacterized protein (DUF2164 family)